MVDRAEVEINERTEEILFRDKTLDGGFTIIPNDVLEAEVISPGAKVIYALLLRFAWQNGKAFPGQERLAEAAGCAKRSVQTYLNELRNVGLISWKRRGTTKTNVYYIHDLKEFLNYLNSKTVSLQENNPRSANFAHQERQNMPSGKICASRSADFAHLDAQKTTHKEYSDQEYPDQEYSDPDLSLDSNSEHSEELESKLRTPNSSILDDLEDIEIPEGLFDEEDAVPDKDLWSYHADFKNAPEGNETHQSDTGPGAVIETLCFNESHNKTPEGNRAHCNEFETSCSEESFNNTPEGNKLCQSTEGPGTVFESPCFNENFNKTPEENKTYQSNTGPGFAIETIYFDEKFDKAPGKAENSYSDVTTAFEEDKPSPGVKNLKNKNYHSGIDLSDNADTCDLVEKSQKLVERKDVAHDETLPVEESKPSSGVKIKSSSVLKTANPGEAHSELAEKNKHAGVCEGPEGNGVSEALLRPNINLTARDIIAMLGDSLREVMSPPAKAYAIAGRLYNLYDFPAAEVAINALRRRIEQGHRIQNPVAYLMKIAREKKKEFEAGETREFEEQKPFSEKYPEEHKRRLEEVRKIYAERRQYLEDYLEVTEKQTASVVGFSVPAQVVPGCPT